MTARTRWPAIIAVIVLLMTACGSSEEPTSTVVDTAMVLPDGFDLQGHRGARGLKPENTLPSFETALDLGVTTLELDLHYSADGEVVVWHDPIVDPSKCGLEDGAPSDIPNPDDPEVPDASLAIRALRVEQLGWYRCDRNPDKERFPRQDASPTPIAGTRYSIVTLDELFGFVTSYANDPSKTDAQRDHAQRVTFNIETKRNPRDPDAIGDGFNGVDLGLFETRVLQIIDLHAMAGRVTIQSFDPTSLLIIRSVDTEIPLAVLTSSGVAPLSTIRSGGADTWSPNSNQVTADLVAEAHDLGLTVVVWTVNTVEEAQRIIAAGVDGLITDHPDLFLSD